MNFHTITTTAKMADWQRRDCTVDAETEETARYYGAVLLGGKKDLGLRFDEVTLKCWMLEHSHDVAIMNLEVTDELGMGMLILGGTHAASKREQVYCKRFSKVMGFHNPDWYLPMPPLEIESRPLFYYVLFRLEREPGAWEDLATKVIRRANGLGIAFLRYASVRHDL